MKKFAFLLLLIPVVIFLSCKRNREVTKAIGIIHELGEQEEFVFIGSNIKDIDSAYQSDSFMKMQIEEGRGIDSILVSPEALQYLSEYISNNCKHPTKDGNKMSEYIVLSYTNVGKEVCSYRRKDEMITYFENMIKWLEKSPYKDEYKRVIEKYQFQVEGIKKYGQRWPD